jgi:hypothetical protein
LLPVVFIFNHKNDLVPGGKAEQVHPLQGNPDSHAPVSHGRLLRKGLSCMSCLPMAADKNSHLTGNLVVHTCNPPHSGG